MSLRRQIFTSFVFVAALPLIVVAFFLFHSSIKLGFELYTQNLQNATDLQSQMFDNSINDFMVRASRFASSEAMQTLMLRPDNAQQHVLEDEKLATEIMQFTNETLDSVIAFAIVNPKGQMLYSSGSNRDITRLADILPSISFDNTQQLNELVWTQGDSCLYLTTPIAGKSADTPQGMLVVVYDSDYFLKGISTYQQGELSNSFIYCFDHKSTIREKKEISGSFSSFDYKLTNNLQGSLTFELDGESNLGYFKRIAKTPWVLVNYMPKSHIYVSFIPYALLGVATLLAALVVILFLSRVQSKRILIPLNQLLSYVEALFVSNGENPPPCAISSKTEIGYLADKFKGMSANIATTQMQLNESNYLYQSILHATYALRISVNYIENTVSSSSPELMLWLDDYSDLDAPEAVMRFFEFTSTRRNDALFETMSRALHGNISHPTEAEACLRYDQSRQQIWFRIIAVPIITADTGVLTKLVLHFENISTKKQEELRLLESSQRDPLCRLLNKQAFGELAHNYMQGKNNHAVFFIDLDNFKQINDRLGHAVGDAVLISCAQTISAQFSATDLVARFGGDEFVVLASGFPVEMIQLKANTLIKKLLIEKTAPEGDVVQVTASVGVYVVTGHPQDLDTMTQYADDAMYQAKKNGKAQYYIIQSNKEAQL